jgi:hypothetical protein
MKEKYRAKQFGSDRYSYGHKYYAYIDKGGHNHCFIYNSMVDDYFPVDEESLEELIDNKWTKMTKIEVEIW